MQRDSSIPDTLRLHPGQQELTPEQEAEARHFARERIEAQLSTEPADEQEAEELLKQAYQVAGLAPPSAILWLDGPLELVELFVPSSAETIVDARAWARLIEGIGENVWERIWTRAWKSVRTDVEFRLQVSVGKMVRASAFSEVFIRVRASVEASVNTRVWARVRDSIRPRVKAGLWDSIRATVNDCISASVRAYAVAPRLEECRFFDEYLASNDVQAMAHFNELVSGYWLGKDLALIVRRPKLLSCDAEGHLHSAIGKCIEYHDGWGCYAWHGVRVPERVILAPETLTREDFLNEPDLEVRRVIQEHMGERFVPELGGYIIESGPRGTLYEVPLPEDDPERVARYVQVQDTSTLRQYFLRVPPTVQRAAEAVAWSFDLPVEEYQPIQET